jgi:hypothetical protein
MSKPDWWPEELEFPDFKHRTTVSTADYGDRIMAHIPDDHLAMEWLIWTMLHTLRGEPDIDIAHAVALILAGEGFSRAQ